MTIIYYFIFFVGNSIDQKILINLIQKKTKDKDTVWLIEKIIKSFEKGLPLGNITSQLFANIYLNELDKFIKHQLRIKYYIRYCDDFIILSSNKNYLIGLIPTIQSFLKNKLSLSFHYNKIILRKWHQGVDFLGYISFPYHRFLRNKTKKRMFRKIERRIEELKINKINQKSFNQIVQSYLGILKHCNSCRLRYKLKRNTLKRFPQIGDKGC